MGDVIADIEKQLSSLKTQAVKQNVGVVTEIGDGVARIEGLSEAQASELLDFGDGIYGLALNLEQYNIGAVILGDFTKVKEGHGVKTTGQVLQVPVGESLVGRVVDPLGNPLDGKGPIKTKERYPVEKIAPGVITRQSVNQPLQTGIKAIDALIPIGRGQRELIIGDRNTGKTTIAIDTIINQKDVVCIYVAIGQKTSKIAQLVAKLEDAGAMEHTIIVAASASDPAPLQYIAPYAGVAMGEYFMDQGKDALIIYDDLSKHAVAGRLKLDLAQFRELAAFAQFSSDLDAGTKSQIERGRRITEVLKQPPYSPVPMEEQAAILWVVTNGYLDELETEKVKDFENEFLKTVRLKNKKLLGEIADKKEIDEKMTKELEKLAKDFVSSFQKTHKTAKK